MDDQTARRGFQFGRHLAWPDWPSADKPHPNPLEEYFDSHTEGPGLWKWRHYFEIYHRHFQKFVGREVHVVEIGVFSGGSLGMWKHYFGPECHIYGVDLNSACRAYEDDQTRIFIGDQEDPAFWDEFVSQVPTVDVVIDDGGHRPEQQIATLEALLPHIRAGGVYLCEDSLNPMNRFHDYVNGLSRNLHHAHPGNSPRERRPTDFQRIVQSVHLYPWVTIIEKRPVPLTELSGPKHGTEWQPGSVPSADHPPGRAS
jgi:hypothetical protein